MKKIFKVLAVLITAFLVVVLGAAVAIRIYLPPEKLKALVVEKMEENLKRKVEVAEVDLGILRGLRISGVRISEKPDFKAGDFLKADAFTFSFAWLPLLHKEVVVHELSLDGLQVTVKKHKDGTTNIPGTTSPPQPSSRKREEGVKAAEAGVGIAALTVGNLRLKDAKIRYIDEGEKTDSSVSIPLATIKKFTLSGSFPFTAKVELTQKTGKDTMTALLETAGTLDLAGGEAAKMQGSVDTLSIKTGGISVKGSLKFSNAVKPKLEGSLDLPALDAKAINAVVPGAAPEGLKAPAARLEFTAASEPPALTVSSFKVEAAGIVLTGKAKIDDTKARTPRISFEAASNTFDIGPVADIVPATRGKGLTGKASFKASGVKTGGTLDLKQLAIGFGDAQATVTGRVTALDSADPALDLDLNTGSISFASFASYLPDISNLTGKARLSASVKGRQSAPKASGSLELTGAGAEYMKQKLEAFTGTVKFSESSVEIPKLTGKINGGDLVLKFSASDPKAPVVTLNGSLSVLNAGALEALMAKTPGDAPAPAAAKTPPYTGPVLRTSGAFTIEKITHPNFSSAKAVLDWNLTGVTPEFKGMDGTAKLRIGEGKAVKLLTLAKEKGGMAKAMVVPLTILDKARGKIPGVTIPSLEEIPFDRIEGDYTFKKGVMNMQPSKLEGPSVTAETRGTVDLAASTLDLRTVMKVPNLGNIALLVTGTMDDPKITPDLEKVKEKAVEKGKDLLKKQGEKLLKGLFNK